MPGSPSSSHPKKCFVTGADANYFPMLAEWVASIQAQKQSADYALCVMDCGLAKEHITYLKQKDVIIKKPDWPTDLPEARIKGKDYLKSCVCRPFINKIFEGFELYIWIDCDIWMQNWSAIPLYEAGAKQGKLALCPQVDRAWPKQMRIKWLGPLPWKPRSFYYSNAKKAFDRKTAQKLFAHHVLQAGAFALTADAPHWERWQSLILKALEKGKVFTAEQLTMGMMIHLDGYAVELLPAWCNWLCEYKPKWDTIQKIWVEPFLPHIPLSLVHLSGQDKMRIDRSVTEEFETLQNETIVLSYRYPGLDGENCL